MKPLMTVDEVADYLKVNRHSVWRWIRQGRLPAVNVAKRTYRVRGDDLQAFLAERTTAGTSQRPQLAPAASAGTPVVTSWDQLGSWSEDRFHAWLEANVSNTPEALAQMLSDSLPPLSGDRGMLAIWRFLRTQMKNRVE